MLSKLTVRFNGRKIDELILSRDFLGIGRNADNDIRLEDATVSSHHARFVRRDGNVYIEDCDSTNGTYVNSDMIELHKLVDNDVIIIGKYMIEYTEINTQPAVADMDPTMQIGKQELDTIISRLDQAQQLSSDSIQAINKKALNWIAQDENGVWWGFENEPVPGVHGWIDGMDGSKVLLKQEQTTNNEWRTTLRRLT